MSFVPFAPAPAAPAAGTAVLPRPGGAPRRQSTHASGPAAAARGAATAPEPRSAGASKARDAFASVLESVQEDAGSDGTAASAKPRSGERTAGESPAERLDSGHEPAAPAPVAVTVEPSPPVPPPTSSWLLLALEHGTLTRTETSTAPAGDETSPEGDTLAASAPIDAAAVVGPVPPAVPMSAAEALGYAGVLPTTAPAVSDSQVLPATAASVSTDADAAPPQQGDALPVHQVGEPPRDAATLAAVRSSDQTPEVGVATSAPPIGVTPEDLPPGNGLGERQPPVEPAMPESAGRPAGRATTDAAAAPPVSVEAARTVPGVAVSRLAQTLSRLAGEDAGSVTPPALTPPAVDANPGASATLPSARATEVLQRLAQAGGPAPTRSHDAGAATPFVVPVGAPAELTAAGVAPAAPPVPALPPAVGEQVAAQIVSSLKMQWRDGIGEAKLHLRPDALGQVSLTLRVEHGAVTAVVRAESPQVQEWVLQHQQVLRQQLHDAGLRLDDLSVNPDGEAADQGQSQGNSEESPQRQPRRRAGRTDSGLYFDQLL